MKKLIASMILTLPLTINASVVAFQCKSTELPGVHKFDAKGLVTIDENNNVEGLISLQTEKAQAPASVQVFEEIKVKGTRVHFEAGKISVNEFDQLILSTNETYIKSVNLLLDFKGLAEASKVLSIDNFMYRSNCSVVESSN